MEAASDPQFTVTNSVETHPNCECPIAVRYTGPRMTGGPLHHSITSGGVLYAGTDVLLTSSEEYRTDECNDHCSRLHRSHHHLNSSTLLVNLLSLGCRTGVRIHQTSVRSDADRTSTPHSFVWRRNRVVGPVPCAQVSSGWMSTQSPNIMK
jgi:hypothetical protein